MDWTVETEGPTAVTDEDLAAAFAKANPSSPFAAEVFNLLARLPATILTLRDIHSPRCEPFPREATVTISGNTNTEGALSVSLTITTPDPPPPLEH